MKQLNTLVHLKMSGESFAFNTAEAWMQGHSGQDIHAIADLSGEEMEVFIPRHGIASITFSTEEAESTPVEDAFCNESEEG